MKLIYFAWVRDKIGHAEETLAPPANVATVGDLVAWLATVSPGHAAAVERRMEAMEQYASRDGPSTVGNASSTQQLKTLVSTLEAACNRAPHNASLRSLQAEALSASGRMAEAHALCEAQLAGAQLAPLASL